MAEQLSLLDDPVPPGSPRLISRPGLRLRHWPGWLEAEPDLLSRLNRQVRWKQETIRLWGRCHPLPRLTGWMADPGCVYRYSGLVYGPAPWSPLVSLLRRRLEATAGCPFNSVLLNLYRDGDDRMGWHADDEPELDPGAPIASLSLGVRRPFQLRPRRLAQEGQILQLELGEGDLLVMDPPTQRHWLHQLPPRRRILRPRLNLTFRRLLQGPGP